MAIVKADAKTLYFGVVDLFATLLPGYVLIAGLSLPYPTFRGLFWRTPESLTWVQAAGLVIVSYLAGQLIFLIGAWWLDEFYDWARKKTLNHTRRRAAERGEVSSWISRVLVWLVFKRESDGAVTCAAALRRESLKVVGGADAINTFQWAKALLTIKSPASLATVQRFEADSKFFRSFVVVLMILACWWGAHQQWAAAAAAIALLPLALWRFMDQRLKSTNQAYWSVITIVARERKNGSVASPATTAAHSGPETHAGGVVYRRAAWRDCRYLLIEASGDSSQWVLPKGHIKADESLRLTAVREVHEEAGVWAVVESDLGTRTFTSHAEMATTRFFLMRAKGRGLRADRNRAHRWVRLDEALKLSSFDETRQLLRQAEAARTRRQAR